MFECIPECVVDIVVDWSDCVGILQKFVFAMFYKIEIVEHGEFLKAQVPFLGASPGGVK
jgi:hypothetical protein